MKAYLNQLSVSFFGKRTISVKVDDVGMFIFECKGLDSIQLVEQSSEKPFFLEFETRTIKDKGGRWICFISGGQEILKVVVSGLASDVSFALNGILTSRDFNYRAIGSLLDLGWAVLSKPTSMTKEVCEFEINIRDSALVRQSILLALCVDIRIREE